MVSRKLAVPVLATFAVLAYLAVNLVQAILHSIAAHNPFR